MLLQRPSMDFDPLKNGAILSAFAEIAYRPVASLARLPRFMCSDPSWDWIKPFKHGSAQGVIAYSQKFRPFAKAKITAESHKPLVLVAIAGTNDFIDVRRDFDLMSTKVSPDGLSFHRGFVDYAIDVREALKPWHKLLASDIRLFLTGHSLGGASTIILPEVLELPPESQAYTFGCPPTIRQGEGGRYFPEVFRFAQIADMVPKVYRWLYEHVGQPFWIRLDGEISGSPSSFQWFKSVAAKYWRIVRTLRPFTANKYYHSMIRYRHFLEETQ